jgi:hypothetical protein
MNATRRVKRNSTRKSESAEPVKWTDIAVAITAVLSLVIAVVGAAFSWYLFKSTQRSQCIQDFRNYPFSLLEDGHNTINAIASTTGGRIRNYSAAVDKLRQFGWQLRAAESVLDTYSCETPKIRSLLTEIRQELRSIKDGLDAGKSELSVSNIAKMIEGVGEVGPFYLTCCPK